MYRLRWFLLILLILMLCSGVSAANIERSISQNGDGTVTVRLTLPDDMIMGITEVIPAGYLFSGTMHPNYQTEIEGVNLRFAVIGEEEIVYTLIGSGLPEIDGTILPISEGGASPIEQSPAPVLVVIGALALAAITLRRRIP
ncbi:MAG: hypothetical protein Q7J09_03070 [Methanocalculus sp.]|uniref:hypothetical protein n=1 Tax=Methanocalculus sp. TaxID=2004547 RepID=UPI002715BF54|nr:hypothetical protein [Methanocalculus sp.]MDO9538972.1 hypothetical protein [Methanocalculus sp.]